MEMLLNNVKLKSAKRTVKTKKIILLQSKYDIIYSIFFRWTINLLNSKKFNFNEITNIWTYLLFTRNVKHFL